MEKRDDGRRSRQLTVLAFHFGNGSNVASSKGGSGLCQGNQDNEAEEEAMASKVEHCRSFLTGIETSCTM